MKSNQIIKAHTYTGPKPGENSGINAGSSRPRPGLKT
jgi:hypothetical protein